MTDFETRLRESLERNAEQAPAVGDLAQEARARLRRRWALLAGACVAALVVAVPAAVTLWPAGSARTGVLAPAGAGEVRVYSLGDATVEIPASWRPDATYIAGDWCNGAERPATGPVGYFGRLPNRTLMLCSDEEPLGNYEPFASFSFDRQGPLQSERDGWVTENIAIGHVWLTLRTDDPVQSAEIKASAHVIQGVDGNGCAPDGNLLGDPDWRPEPQLSLTSETAVSRIVSCAYGHLFSGDQGPSLERSDEFTGADAHEVLRLVLTAEPTTPNDDPCMVSAAGYDLLTVFTADGSQQVLIRTDGCHGLGSDDGSTYRADSSQLDAWLEYGAQPPEGPTAASAR